jgi:hypothetical protein|tara:strand:- start:745 stop:945 length:201 start_codon:yes stop_codon:yes gene_type:complete
MKSEEIPVIKKEGKNWFLLNFLSTSGTLRAVYISKPKQVLDWDKHHCNELKVKKSIRYYPKMWDPE